MTITTVLFLASTGMLAVMGLVVLLEGVLMATSKIFKVRGVLRPAALASLVFNRHALR